MSMARWEHGSDFPWPDVGAYDAGARHPWTMDASFYGSGRDALRALLMLRRWRRLWVPSYFCQEVLNALAGTGVDLSVYRDGPTDPRAILPETRRGDAILVVNHFGLRRPPSRLPDAPIIEDHTHDPWSAWARSSRADYCVASLRKTLPLPDGGVVWSPQERILPRPAKLTDGHVRAVADRARGMLMKRLYLQGGRPTKDAYRAALARGERDIARGAVSAMMSQRLLSRLPAAAWRSLRARNHAWLATLLAGARHVRVLHGAPPGSCPFSLVLVFDTPRRRDETRERLIRKRIYPAVLWNLDRPVVAGIPADDADLSRRVLSLHCDYRYGRRDLSRVARALRRT